VDNIDFYFNFKWLNILQVIKR